MANFLNEQEMEKKEQNQQTAQDAVLEESEADQVEDILNNARKNPAEDSNVEDSNDEESSSQVQLNKTVSEQLERKSSEENDSSKTEGEAKKSSVRIMAPAAKNVDTDVEEPSGERSVMPSNALERKKGEKRPSRLFVQYYSAFCLVLVTVFFVSGYLLLEPKITNFKRINESIGVTLQEIEDVESFLTSVERSISAAEQIPEDVLYRVNESLPKETDIPKLLRTFATIAKQNHVIVSGVQFSQRGLTPEEQMTGVQLAPIDINLAIEAPGYLATKSFLKDLEQNVRLLDVRSINVGEGSTGSFSYTLELTTYALDEKKDIPASVLAPDGSIRIIDGVNPASVGDPSI